MPAVHMLSLMPHGMPAKAPSAFSVCFCAGACMLGGDGDKAVETVEKGFF